MGAATQCFASSCKQLCQHPVPSLHTSRKEIRKHMPTKDGVIKRASVTRSGLNETANPGKDMDQLPVGLTDDYERAAELLAYLHTDSN